VSLLHYVSQLRGILFGDRLVPAASATTVVPREHQLIVGRLSSRIWPSGR
jgi:hypothetical protein